MGRDLAAAALAQGLQLERGLGAVGHRARQWQQGAGEQQFAALARGACRHYAPVLVDHQADAVHRDRREPEAKSGASARSS